jgi:hypothetical protein
MQWRRGGFRLAWRWRSGALGPGRPKIASDTRDLIRQMSTANPLWGAPRIHGELLKLGIKVSRATVGRYMPWRPKEPSPTWRSFLRNHMTDIAAVDMFVVATATFGLLYAVIVLDHHRRRIIHFEVTQSPTQAWLARQIIEAFPWDTAPRYLLRDAYDHFQREALASRLILSFSILPRIADPSCARQGLPGTTLDIPTRCRKHLCRRACWRSASSVRTSSRMRSAWAAQSILPGAIPCSETDPGHFAPGPTVLYTDQIMKCRRRHLRQHESESPADF